MTQHNNTTQHATQDATHNHNTTSSLLGSKIVDVRINSNRDIIGISLRMPDGMLCHVATVVNSWREL